MTTRLEAFQSFRNPRMGASALANAQAKRRAEALERQKAQRQQAFSLTRLGLEDFADDLTLSDSDDDSSQPDTSTRNASVLADTVQTSQSNSIVTQEQKERKVKRKWRGHANKLMTGEEFDPKIGLPADLCPAWLAIGPVPEGKRCMAVTFAPGKVRKRGRVTNTLLFSRVAGRPLGRHYIPVLPADCILDCIFAENLGVLFVMDVMSWKGQSIAECDATFRMFWRDSKFAEISPQVPAEPYDSEDTRERSKHSRRKASHLVAAAVPALIFDSVAALYANLVEPMAQEAYCNISYAMQPVSLEQRSCAQFSNITYKAAGILLALKEASYESGITPLVMWIRRTSLRALFAGHGTALPNNES